MIQPLPTRRDEWLVYWVETDIPVRNPKNGLVILPTLILVTDPRGVPVAKVEMLPELDQPSVEELLARLFRDHHKPEKVLIADSPEWDEMDWYDFGYEHGVHVVLTNLKSDSVVRMLDPQGLGLADFKPPKEFGELLTKTASIIISTRRREEYLRKALEINPDIPEALVELGEIEASYRQFRKALEHFEKAISIEAKRWEGKSPQWWVDIETQTYLRALEGRGMALWDLDNLREAAYNFSKMLQLNPTDHQGIRFFLPLVWLLANRFDKAVEFFQHYTQNYVGDITDPGLNFCWGFVLNQQGDEAGARKKYQTGILKNIYIAPLMIEEKPPPGDLWVPGERANLPFAKDFARAYGSLWESEPRELRLLREIWHEMLPRVNQILDQRMKLMDMRDLRYDPQYREHWKALEREEERLTRLPDNDE